MIDFRNAVQEDPRLGSAHERLGDVLVQTGDRTGAVRQYVLAADLRPEDVRLQIKTGSMLLSAGRFDDAKARAEAALIVDPRNVEAQLVIANALAGLKDVDGAVAQVEDALRIDPAYGNAYSNLGALELSRGRYEDAERAFRKATTLSPDSAVAQLALGTFYWLNDQRQEAEQALTRAHDLNPRSVSVNRALASFFLSTNRADRAEPFLRAVVDISHSDDAALALADYYQAIGKPEAERDTLTPLLRKSGPVTAAANARLAALDAQDGRSDDALRRVTGILASDPQDLQALVVKTTVLLGIGRPDDALESATAATHSHADSTLAWYALGRTQWARKQTDAAVAAFQQVLRLNPRAQQAKVALSQLQLTLDRADASIQLSSEALADDPRNGDARLVLVRGLLARGELDLAAAELKQLRARFPQSAVVHTQTGVLLGRRNDPAGARNEFERALALNPTDLEAIGGIVALDVAAKDFAAARARINERLAGNRSAALLTLAARVEAVSGDANTAETLLREAISHDASDIPAYRQLGQLYLAQRKLAEAQAEFETAATHSTKPVAELTMVGILLQARDRQDEARARFERVLQLDPDAPVAANNLAWIMVQTGGNLDVAMQLAKRAQKRLPTSPEVNDTVGYIFFKLGFSKLAISALELSTAEDSRNATYQYHLGLAFASGGDRARAVKSLERALALNPGLTAAQDSLHEVESTPDTTR